MERGAKASLFSCPFLCAGGSPVRQASALYTENMETNNGTDDNDMTAEDNSVPITNGDDPFEDSE